MKRQIVNVAAGSEDSDAVNVAQLRSVENSIETTVRKNIRMVLQLL